MSRSKSLIALLASVLSIASLAGGPARADVTVVIRGSYGVSAGLALDPTMTRRINAVLNPTIYFKGNSCRFDSDVLSEIYNYSRNIVMTINNEQQIYFVTKTGRAQEKAFNQLFDLNTDEDHYRNIHRTVTHIHCNGHKCVRYITTFAFQRPGYYDIDYRIVEIDALDVKGFTPQRTPDGEIVVPGVPLKYVFQKWNSLGTISAQMQAASISTAPLTASTFAVGKDFRLASRAEVVGSEDTGSSFEIPTSLMSGRVADPYVYLNDDTGFDSEQALIKARKFEVAAALARSLAARHHNNKLGPVYLALADHSQSMDKGDQAWGWYSLVVTVDDNPADLVRAHKGLGDYYAGNKDVDDARKQYQAIINLPGAAQADKDQATAELERLSTQ